MADFMYKQREKIYGGGYIKEMTKEEYSAFLESLKRKDIDIFMNFFNI